MKFAEADTDGGHLIEGYEPGRILIDGRSYSESLIVSPGRIISDWGPAAAADLSMDHFAALLALEPQVIVVGTGERQVFPDPPLYFSLLERGVGVEIMDTGAACRTYNILMAEGRKVAAGLIMR
ncbi:MAG: Mth938-like domain-containing protein [Pseudomonadota bacterium]|nr:Mth938-like domain-containing protein [Pseudomonadota bacterium]